MSGLRRVLLPSKEIASRRWARWEMFDEHGERVGWVTEDPRGGQVYDFAPGEWTARATDGWSESGYDGAVKAEAALERHLDD